MLDVPSMSRQSDTIGLIEIWTKQHNNEGILTDLQMGQGKHPNDNESPSQSQSITDSNYQLQYVHSKDPKT